MMKITFVQPPTLMAVDSYSTFTQPPIGIACLAAFCRELGHDIHIVDAVGEDVKSIKPWPGHKKRLVQGLSFQEIVTRIPADSDIIGFSCMYTHAWPMIRELIITLKKEYPRAKFIAGGEHVTALYDIVLTQAPIDVCVLGEGEHTLGELLDAFQNDDSNYSKIDGIAFINKKGEVIKTNCRKRITNLDELPWPAWDLINPMAYMENEVYMGPAVGRSMPIIASRGCPFDCTFCPAANMWNRVWRVRNPIKVVDEIEFYTKQYQANDFQLQDLTAILRKDWILAFSKELIRRKLNISWQIPVGTRSDVFDSDVIEHMVASGCNHITFAPESGSERILKVIKKKVKLDQLEEVVKMSLKKGMYVCLFHVIGFPQEGIDDIKKTFKWLRHMAKIGVHEITVSTYVLVPGSELFYEINKTRPIAINDDYFHMVTGITSMLTVRSWNQKISDIKLLFLKLWGLTQFYAVSFCFYPNRLWRLLYNVIRNKQETKVDRVIREFIIKIPIALGLSKRGKS